jgi:hypothetical protein
MEKRLRRKTNETNNLAENLEAVKASEERLRSAVFVHCLKGVFLEFLFHF